ncbi:MAG: aminodeoxychorismate synthase component I [Candidatus Poribacteria bacterium]|nr:aminodeoxychorismate synthase component I [Candidatus Poribacteria bacterium]
MANQVIVRSGSKWLHFKQPLYIIETHRLDEVISKLQDIEEIASRFGLYVAGFISYEAASAFDSALTTFPSTNFPLIWFGLYKEPDSMNVLSSFTERLDRFWIPSIDQNGYRQILERIKGFIAAGETYQVNYTFRLHSKQKEDPLILFRQLMMIQPAGYASYVETDQFAICSASPELFFNLDDHQLITRPMKGTATRGLTLSADQEQSNRLQNSLKDRAENLMIVDMMRNDLGRIASPGSIKVPKLFEVEKYPTVWQMTSTVSSQTQASFSEILTALFPSASITGAPKVQTMKIITDLENSPRKIYTGTIGYLSPNRKAQFNVAIRTVLIDKWNGTSEYGVGSGVVWDSVDQLEFEECMVKAKILTEPYPNFSIFESLLWENKNYFLLAYHLDRLHSSAKYFDFPIDVSLIEKRLLELSTTLSAAEENKPHKIRLVLSPTGQIECQSASITETQNQQPIQIKLASVPIDPSNRFLYHKTTQRDVYDQAKMDTPDCDDILLWNKRGEITESCVANVVVDIKGELITPPISSGLLAGTFRAWLLDQQKISEEIITIDDILLANRIYLINSVRKWRQADLTAPHAKEYRLQRKAI